MAERMISPRLYQPRKFEPVDTTWRDGLQSPLWRDFGRISPSSNEVVELAVAQMRYGVRFFELFAPVIHEKAAHDLGLVIRARNEQIPELKHPIYILCHSGVDERSVEKALAAGVDGLNLFFGTSQVSLDSKHKERLTLADVARKSRQLIEQIRRTHPDIWIRFSGEDAFRTKTDDLFIVYDELADLVDAFGTPDTVGGAHPREVSDRVNKLIERYPKVKMEGHFQNDRGLALYNAMTAIEAGMGFIDTSVLGIAERSGLPSLTALIFNLDKEMPNAIEGFDLSSSYALNVLLADIMQMQVPWQEPVSATNRTHSAGIHTAAVLRNIATYEAHDLARFGVTKNRLLLSPLSGKHHIHYYLTHFLDYDPDIPSDVLDAITTEFKNTMANIGRDSKMTPELWLWHLGKHYKLKKLEKPVVYTELLDK